MIYAIGILLLVGLDQLTKWYIYTNRVLYQDMVIIPKFFHLTYVENRGAAFSILQNARWFFVIVTIIAVVVMIIYMVRNRNLFMRITLAVLVAGAVGNLIDRIRYGYVVDFFNFYIFGYDFPVFNVADIAVTIGCGLFFVYMFFLYKEPDKVPKSDLNDPKDSGEPK